MSTTERRAIQFDHIDEIMPEVDRLLAGHRTLGNWSLGQICNHLAASFRHTIEGYHGRLPWVVRRTFGPFAFGWISRTGTLPAGVKAPAEVGPLPGLDDRAEAEALRASIRIFNEYVGPIPEHPVFGRVSKDQLARLHCIHSAHHLSFVLPETGATATVSESESSQRESR